MNPKKSLLILSAVTALLVVSAALPLAIAADQQTASGIISSVGDTSFALRVDNGPTMQFITDGDTVVEGELKVGADATVTYRVEDGKNIAERVQVKA